MSADNGIYILESEGPEWRVIEAQAIDNIRWNEDSGQTEPGYFNMKEVEGYFGNAEVFLSSKDADKEAFRLEREIAVSACPVLEYGISNIRLPGKFPKHNPCSDIDEEWEEMAKKREGLKTEYTITIVAKTPADALGILANISQAIIDGFILASWVSDNGDNSYSFTSKEQ